MGVEGEQAKGRIESGISKISRILDLSVKWIIIIIFSCLNLNIYIDGWVEFIDEKKEGETGIGMVFSKERLKNVERVEEANWITIKMIE